MSDATSEPIMDQNNAAIENNHENETEPQPQLQTENNEIDLIPDDHENNELDNNDNIKNDTEEFDDDLDDLMNDAINTIVEDNNTNENENEDENDSDSESNTKDLSSQPTASSSSSSSSARPKRKNTKNVNYTDKGPSFTTLKVENKRGSKSRRGKNNSDSSSPGPQSTPSKKISYYDVEDVVPINYQPPILSNDNFNQIVDFKNAKIDKDEISITLKNGLTIKKGDCIYMICEPPTEPFYIAQIMGFTKKDKNATINDESNYMFSVCWFYRPRDLNRRITDTRLVYASLHRDDCPLTSFRGFVTVKHKSEIQDIENFKKQPDSFYFDKLYDRYMIKMYDMIPTIQLVHLPSNYYKALHKRFEFIFVEVGKADELLSSPKNCEKCLQWSSNSDAIMCSGCQKSYHFLCLDPPILTKPKRGFAWYCAACNKELEDKLAESRGKMLESSQPSQIIKQENRLAMMKESDQDESENNASSDNEEINSNNNNTNNDSSLKYEEMAKKFLEDDKNITLKRRREIEEWPYRYLGVHAKFEDALDLQDRPYARAASRLGSKYQCTSITNWYDHKVQYYDTDSKSLTNNKRLKKYYNRSKKSTTPIPDEEDSLQQKKFPIPDEYKDVKPKDFPGWLQPKPKGYIERGTDETSTLLWKMPTCSSDDMRLHYEKLVDDYIKKCSSVAQRLKLITDTTPNFIDAILLILMRHDYKPEECMDDVNKLTRESLKEPTFTDEEVKRFEDSVRLHGSELFPVFKDVRTQPCSMIVRFYYLWKKTKNGHEIWDNFAGRAKNRLKNTKKVGVDLDNPDDDGLFSSTKSNKNNVSLKCMYCETNHSTRWFRAPGAIFDEEKNMCEGLCNRCAKLWRKYATKWENPIELIKNQEKKAAYAVKKKTEYALIEEAELVVKARENYKLNPLPTTSPLKKFKTIDTDYNYNTDEEPQVEVTKKKVSRKKPKELKQAPTTQDAQVSSTSKKVTDKLVIKKESKSKGKTKEQRDAERSGIPVDFADFVANGFTNKSKRKKRSKLGEKGTDENDETVDKKELAQDDKDHKDEEKLEKNPSDEPVKKKRKYIRKKPIKDNEIKFVYGKVVDVFEGTKKLTVKKSECYDPSDDSNPSEYDKAVEIVNKIEELKAEIEENDKSNTFNAFLDMKLREKLEVLEEKLASLKSIKTSNEYEKVNLELSGPNSTPPKSEPTSSRPTSKDLEHTFPAGKRYVRRRVFLSKASVPGSGIFETPPIQLPMMDFNAPSDDLMDFSTENTNMEFQSQPTVLLPKSFPVGETTKNPKKVNRGKKRDRPYNQLMNILPMAKGNGNPLLLSAESSKAPASANSSSKTTSEVVKSVNTSGSITSNGKQANAFHSSKSPSTIITSFTIKGRQYLALVDSSEVKPLLTIIDCTDSISKRLFSRYVSKFNISNPLISENILSSPLYQLRPSSKEIQAAWKYLQTSKKTKVKFSKAFEPLFPPDSRPCCVCREMGDVSRMIICSNCGLNVHASCYGVELPSKMKRNAGEYNWHCDPCSNDLHVLVSTQYVCMLCNSRESNMDSAIKGDPISIPDALKRTAEGRWCHVSCSLLCDQIKYGSQSLQPIYGASVTGLKNVLNSCKVCCNMGGAIVNCDFCATTTHVTCGLDFGWHIGFKLVNVFDIADGDVVEIAKDKAVGKLVPIISCEKPNSETNGRPLYYSFSDIGRKINVENGQSRTLIELYASDERKLVDDSANGLTRRKYFDKLLNEFDNLVSKAKLKVANGKAPDSTSLENVTSEASEIGIVNVEGETEQTTEQEVEQEKPEHVCARCFNTSSLLWYTKVNPEDGSTDEECHLCHNKHNYNEDNSKTTIPQLREINNYVFDY